MGSPECAETQACPCGGQRATRVQQWRSKQGRMPRFSWWNSTSCSRSVKRVWPSSMLKYRRPSSSLWGVAIGGGRSGRGLGPNELPPGPGLRSLQLEQEEGKSGRPEAHWGPGWGGGLVRRTGCWESCISTAAGTWDYSPAG